jgi:hypothetical protein
LIPVRAGIILRRMKANAALARLEKLRLACAPAAAAEKLLLLRILAKTRLGSTASVLRLHEILCWMRAYPDDRKVLAAVAAALEGFAARRDLRRFRAQLDDSGIAGTTIRYAFFWPMARWLAARWPQRLRFDRDDDEAGDRLRAAFPTLLPPLQAEGAKRSECSPCEILDGLRGSLTDAVFFLHGIERMPGDNRVRETFHDVLEMPYVLDPAPGSPSRTLARWPKARVAFSRSTPERGRPDLRRELGRPPVAVRAMTGAGARQLIDLAREAMVTRSRDLDAFTWGNPRDVHLVDDGEGLAFAFIGAVPERRLPLPAMYGYLALRNGVPIAYGQVDALLGGASIAFNLFETFRGGEAAFCFARLLAATRALLGAAAFSIEPYQLGHKNEEGLASGSWWFYYKLGFRPRDPAVKKIVASELARARKRPAHRSSEATLEKLARAHLYWEPVRGKRSLLPLVPSLGLRLPALSGDEAVAIARQRVGLRSLAGWRVDERNALRVLAPLIAALPGIEAWTAAERQAAVVVVRAKGGWRDVDFAQRLSAHPRLGAAMASCISRRLGSP